MREKSMKHHYIVGWHRVYISLYSKLCYTIVARSTRNASCMRRHASSWPGDRSLRKVAGFVILLKTDDKSNEIRS